MTRTRRLISALAGPLLALGVSSTARADTWSSPVLAAITLPAGQSALDEVTVGSAIWTLSADPDHGYLFRIDPVSDAVTAEIDLPSGSPSGDAFYQGVLAYAYGSLWVPATFHDEILRIDPVAMRIIARIHTGRFPAYLTAGGGSIWVAQDEATSVARIDPDTNALVATIPIGSQGSGKVQPFDVTWDPHTDQVLVTLNPGQGRIALIDGASQQVHMLDVATVLPVGARCRRRTGSGSTTPAPPLGRAP